MELIWRLGSKNVGINGNSVKDHHMYVYTLYEKKKLAVMKQYAKFNSSPKLPATMSVTILPDANVDLSTNELNPLLPSTVVTAADGRDRIIPLLRPAVCFKCTGCRAEPEVRVAMPLVVAVAAVLPSALLVAGVHVDSWPECCILS